MNRTKLIAPLLAGALAAPAQAATARLDVLTINAWDLPWPVSLARHTRVAALAERVRGRHDVVAFQELWRKDAPRFNRKLLRPPDASRSGLALLTGHTVVDHRFRPFSERRGIEHLKRKGVMGVRLALDGLGEATVAVLHTQAGRRGGHVRRRQVEEAVSWLDTWSADAPVVLAGDFNLDERSAADQDTARWLADQGFTDPQQDQATWAGGNPWVPPGRSARYDRVYVRSTDTVRATVEATELAFTDAPVSDHYGLRAVVRLNRD